MTHKEIQGNTWCLGLIRHLHRTKAKVILARYIFYNFELRSNIANWVFSIFNKPYSESIRSIVLKFWRAIFVMLLQHINCTVQENVAVFWDTLYSATHMIMLNSATKIRIDWRFFGGAYRYKFNYIIPGPYSYRWWKYKQGNGFK